MGVGSGNIPSNTGGGADNLPKGAKDTPSGGNKVKGGNPEDNSAKQTGSDQDKGKSDGDKGKSQGDKGKSDGGKGKSQEDKGKSDGGKGKDKSEGNKKPGGDADLTSKGKDAIRDKGGMDNKIADGAKSVGMGDDSASDGNNPEPDTSDNDTGSDSQDKGDGKGNDDSKDESGGDTPDKKGGAIDKLKDGTANATGVDYSDKDLQDQLEHQAADVTMDAIPVAGEINAGRKALKKFNAQKKAAGVSDEGVAGITDKVEDVADKGVSGGIKAVKFGVGAVAVGALGYGAILLAAAIKLAMMIKAMIMGILAKIMGAITAVVNAVATFLSSALALTTTVATYASIGILTVFIASTSIVSLGFIGDITLKRDDSASLCVPDETSVTAGSQEYVSGSEGNYGINVLHEEHALKIWSVVSEFGATKTKAAGLIGNFHYESSGLDPTAVETIYDEPFQIGPRKQAAVDAKFDISVFNPGNTPDSVNLAGIGISQFSNTGNQALQDFMEEHDLVWHDIDNQLRFMFEGDSDYDINILTDILSRESSATLSEETEAVMLEYLRPHHLYYNLDERLGYAVDYMFLLEGLDPDTDYADSILSGVNIDRAQANSSRDAYHADDGCGDTIKSHYGDYAADGTGEIPAGMETGVAWTEDTMPESMKEFTYDPRTAGLMFGTSLGWTTGIIPGQCAALSASYIIQLYPDYNKDGRPASRPTADGWEMAKNWANHYGEPTSKTPIAGATFSNLLPTSTHGHTGIVQHVFANGDIMIIEENAANGSGASVGMIYSWSWRAIPKAQYENQDWTFFKPSTAEPQWIKNQE